MRLRSAFTGLLAGVLVLFCLNAYAIPTFARKYRTSCQTCHLAFPKLTPFGEAFRKNGYMIPEGDMAYVKEEPISLGAEAYKRVWPDAVWPTTLPAYVPLSVVVNQRFRWVTEGSDQKTQFIFPDEVELLTAGTFGDMISFFSELEFEDNAVEMGNSYIVFNDLIRENLFNLKLGYFSIMSNRPYNSHYRLGISRNSIEDYSVSPGGFRLRDLQAGLELNGFCDRVAYAVGLVNGTGEFSDDNKRKDPYGRLDVKLLGLPFDSSGAEAGSALASENNWQDNSLQIGVFGYSGKEEHTTASSSYDNKFYRAGVDGRILFYNLDIMTGYLWGNDDNPSGSGASVDSNAWFVEANYVLYPWLIPSLRYEEANYDDRPDIEKIVPGVSILVRANLRAILEGEIYVDDADGDNRVTMDLRYAF